MIGEVGARDGFWIGVCRLRLGFANGEEALGCYGVDGRHCCPELSHANRVGKKTELRANYHSVFLRVGKIRRGRIL